MLQGRSRDNSLESPVTTKTRGDGSLDQNRGRSDGKNSKILGKF